MKSVGTLKILRGVAQLARVLEWNSRGIEFNSHHLQSIYDSISIFSPTNGTLKASIRRSDIFF